MHLAIVHQGGGAKGAFGAGVIKRLDEAGFFFDYRLGTSIGAVNTAAYAQLGADKLASIWQAISEKDVLTKYGLLRSVTRLVTGAKGVYDFGPFYQLLLDKLGPGPYRNTNCGMVSLVSGQHFCVPATAETVYASGSMPIFAEPVKGEWIDGGVRCMTPLAAAIDSGVDGIVVVLCTPRGQMIAAPRPKNILDVALRTIDITYNQIATYDIQIAIEKNNLVAAAEATGQVPLSPSGVPYRYVPIMVIEPPEWLGGTLDFTRGVLDHRFELGYSVAEKLLAGGHELVETEIAPRYRKVVPV